MKQFRASFVAAGVALVLLLAAAGLMFDAPFRWLPRTNAPPVPLDVSEPLLRAHRAWIRTDSRYAERLKSVAALRASQLAPDPGTSPEDEVLSAAARLLAAGTTGAAAQAAARRVAQLAPRLTAATGRAGIVMGPRITPELVRARIPNPEARRAFAALVCEFQEAECVRALLSRMAEPDSSPPAPGAGAGGP